MKSSWSAGNRLLSGQQRFKSSYVSNLARRVREADEASEAAHLRELYHRNDPEAVIRLFESQPSLHYNRSALSEYVKALVQVDRLDESQLLKTLQKGECSCYLASLISENVSFAIFFLSLLENSLNSVFNLIVLVNSLLNYYQAFSF